MKNVNKIVISVMLTALVSAPPGIAQTSTRADVFLRAVEANGCAVATDQARPFFHANGFEDVEDRVRLAVALMQDGVVSANPDGLQVFSGPCGNSAPSVPPVLSADRVLDFVTFLMGNDCSLTLPSQIEVLGAAGFDDLSELRTLLLVSLSLGLAEMSDDGQRLSATDGICSIP